MVLCGLSALTGLLVFLSFPPVDLAPLAFIAFVPLLVAVQKARSTASAALCGGVAAAFAYVPAFAWVASVTIGGWLALSLYVGLYLVLAAVAARHLSRLSPLLWPLLVAMVWTGLELFRARLGPGFPWLFLGYTQYRFRSLVQVSAWTGVYGVSFLVFWCSAGLASVLHDIARPSRRRGRAVWLHAILPVLAIGLSALLGPHAGKNVRIHEGPVVGAVQQNIPRRRAKIFNRTVEESCAAAAEELERVARLTRPLADHSPHMVVWPETTIGVPLNAHLHSLVAPARRLLTLTFQRLRETGAALNCPLLVGTSMLTERAARGREVGLYGPTVTDRTNSALLISPRGEIRGRYDKVHLVPFGEYVPWVDILPFLQAFTPFTRNLRPGEELVLFPLPDAEGQEIPFGALICYEDVFPGLVRDFRRQGARFFVNLTDEGWYFIPGELRQHLAMAVFRAVETRTTVVRAANTGVTCFIGPRGEVYARLQPGRQGTLAAPVRLCDYRTPYMRFGDAFAVGCLMLAIALPGVLAALRAR